LGRASGGDQMFRDLVLARIIEPVSKLDSLRVLEEAGVAPASYATLKRRLPVYAKDSWRPKISASCAAHAGLGRASLVLYDVSTLFFQTDEGDGFRESGLVPPNPQTIRVTTEGTQSLYWEFVASVPARGVSGYGYMAPTTSDSLPGGIPWNVFFVDAKDATSPSFYVSAADSGYSVDNLPPGPPAGVAAAFAAGTTYLHWSVNAEADFAMYRVYRGTSAGFVPELGNLVATKSDTGYADVGPAGAYYKISAVDVHGNESGFALVTPTITSGVSGNAPLSFALAGVFPNPALSHDLAVRFVLPLRAAARLELIDVAGRSVVSREVGTLEAGAHTVNLAEHARIRPGLYFVRLRQGANEQVRRVTVLE